MKQFLVDVAIENVAYHFDILYGYLIPEDYIDSIKPGARVLVSFGRGKNALRQGIVFELSSAKNIDGYKSVSSVIVDEDAWVNEEILSVARFLKDRTFCTYFEQGELSGSSKQLQRCDNLCGLPESRAPQIFRNCSEQSKNQVAQSIHRFKVISKK